MRAGTYHALRDYDRSIADASKAIELDDAFLPAYIGRASTYAAKKEPDLATLCWRLPWAAGLRAFKRPDLWFTSDPRRSPAPRSTVT